MKQSFARPEAGLKEFPIGIIFTENEPAGQKEDGKTASSQRLETASSQRLGPLANRATIGGASQTPDI